MFVYKLYKIGVFETKGKKKQQVTRMKHEHEMFK